MRFIPLKGVKSVYFGVNKNPSNIITLSRNDSEMSSKGGVGGFKSISSTDVEEVCDTCGFKGFDCPNHITYIKTKKGMYDFSSLSVIIDEYGSTLNKIISWIIDEYKKKYDIESFIYDEFTPINNDGFKNVSKFIFNGKVFNPFSAKESFDSFNKNNNKYFKEAVDILNHIKLKGWSKKYKVLETFKRCKKMFLPVLPPRLYRTDQGDKNGIQRFFRKTLDDPSSNINILKALYNTGDMSMSIVEMLKSKHMSLEGNVTARRFNSLRFILSGCVFLHPSEVSISDYAADNLYFTETVTKFNISNLMNSKYTFVKRNGKVTKTRNLKVGDIVYRMMIDNIDIGILNRDPSLDEGSLFGVKVRRRHDPSNVSLMIPNYVTPRLNADFDGDEGNLYMGTSSYSSNVIYNNISIENKPLTTYERYSTIGLHMDSFLFLYIISSHDKFDFPVMNMMFDDNKDGILIPPEVSIKYDEKHSYSKINNNLEYVFISREDLNSDKKSKKILEESFKRLNIKEYPFKMYSKVPYDVRVKYMKNCVGFKTMKGYDMLDYLFEPFNFKADRSKRYSKSDFKHGSDNQITWMFRNFDSNLVMDWLWIVSNFASMFFTYNTKYATLKIGDINNKNHDKLYKKLTNIQELIYDEDLGKDLLKKYDQATNPKLSDSDFIKRNEFYAKIQDMFDSIIESQPRPSNNQLLIEAESGSKGNTGKFDNIYYSYGALRNLGIILPNSLNEQVMCNDDFKNIFRYGFIRSSLGEGLDPLEYYLQLSIMHIALQQTPLQTKETGAIEKSLTPVMSGLFIKNGVLENEKQKLYPVIK